MRLARKPKSAVRQRDFPVSNLRKRRIKWGEEEEEEEEEKLACINSYKIDSTIKSPIDLLLKSFEHV
jgi:hypothetical protein